MCSFVVHPELRRRGLESALERLGRTPSVRRALLLALLSGSAAPAAAAPALLRGPYLQNATPNAISIRWRTDVACDSRIRYGKLLHSLTSTTDNTTLTTEHEVRLTGLSTNQRYYYSIGTTTAQLAGDDDSTHFRTNPKRGDISPIRMWAIGDAGTGTTDQRSVRAAFEKYAGRHDPDLWLMLGDNAYPDGADADYTSNVFNMYRAMMRKACLWPTRGNHDNLSSSAPDYYDHFTMPMTAEAGGLPSGTEAYYSFDFGNIHFICLDSEGSDRSVGGPMLSWLRQDVAATNQTWILCYWHHPPYSKGSHDSDDPSNVEMFDMRQNVLPILDSTGVDLVMCGHSHDYERSFLLRRMYGTSNTLASSMIVNGGTGWLQQGGAYLKPTLGSGPFEGAIYVVDGSSGKTGGGTLNHPVMVESFNLLGSFVIDINGRRLDGHFVNATGAALDSFTIIKGSVTETGTPGTRALALALSTENPSRNGAVMRFTLPRAGRARLDVLDVHGRWLAKLVDEVRNAGEHQAAWNGRDRHGAALPSGVYFAVLESASERRAVRIVLAR